MLANLKLFSNHFVGYINYLFLHQIFAKLLTEKMREVNLEKTRTQIAMHAFLPKTIVCSVRRKKVTKRSLFIQNGHLLFCAVHFVTQENNLLFNIVCC